MRLQLPTPSLRYVATALSLMLSLWSPASATTVMPMKIVCPIDGQVFYARQIMSVTSQGIGLDFKPLGSVPAPQPLPQCPGNGFVMYKASFTSEEIERFKAFVATDTYQGWVAQHTPYYLVAKLKAEAGEKIGAVADALMQATWEVTEPAQYRTYAQAALAAYEQELAESATTDAALAERRLTATVMAGELERRLGLFERAQRRFAAIAHPETLPQPMRRMVPQQLALIARRDASFAALQPEPGRPGP